MRVIKILLGVVVVLVAAGLFAAWQIGAWNLLFPNRDHDTVAPTLPSSVEAPAVLVFTKTNGFRHVEGIAGGLEALQSIVARHGWSMFHTENGAVFNPGDLARFGAVVFLNASGDMLNEAQELAFQAWLESGGGWLGVHAAGDSSHKEWRWYRDNLIGADFTAHIMGPQFQTATVMLENSGHPVLAGLPDVWDHEEEWYSWEKSPRTEGFTILATVDEESYTPEQKFFFGEPRDLRMGDHPVVWSNCVGEGRSVYATMGHRAEAFVQPQVRAILDNALAWLMRSQTAAQCAAAIATD
jgi:type 1 glutamine amidotransferase